MEPVPTERPWLYFNSNYDCKSATHFRFHVGLYIDIQSGVYIGNQAAFSALFSGTRPAGGENVSFQSPDAPAFDPNSVAYFELPEKRVAISAKIPESSKRALVLTVALWRAKAVASGSMSWDEAKKRIDMTYVVERLLKVGLDGLWAEEGKPIGLVGMPRNQDEWTALERYVLGMLPKSSLDSAD